MVKSVHLFRHMADERGVLGTLYVDGRPICFTVERPWLDNAPNVSCIPAGEYRMVRTTTGRTMPDKYIGDTFEVVDVPGRSQIKFHVANRPSELQGCIAPNMSVHFTTMSGAYSKDATEKFMDAMSGSEEAIFLVRWS